MSRTDQLKETINELQDSWCRVQAIQQLLKDEQCLLSVMPGSEDIAYSLQDVNARIEILCKSLLILAVAIIDKKRSVEEDLKAIQLVIECTNFNKAREAAWRRDNPDIPDDITFF
jgi:hypothetical protein